ncbi:carbohydrate-binding module family 13 protein [Rhizophagus irregularis DAOM 181602=DAOM 197198]|nr:carbohydrate-binding module family 13 protein [Rhizophagus irregularis DAOM 181602=DAOM 197198]
MANYYWIISQHSGMVLEVAGGSYSEANIMQYHKKHENDCSVGTQLWFFDGGLITNKRSGLVLDVTERNIQNGTQIIQRASGSEPSVSQEWDYNYEDNTISLRSNRNFVLDIKDKSKDNWIPIILHSKHDGQNQRFNLLKWNNNSGTDAGRLLVTNIIEDNKFLSKLSQNLLEILADDEYYDVTIEVGNDPNKDNGTLAHIKLPNILPETFEIIIRYIYGGKLSLKEYDTSNIIKLLVAANELNLQELITYIQSHLVENEMNWMEQHFNLIYRTSFENDSFFGLQRYCNELISKKPEKIFKSQDFNLIPENLLISVIRENNLQMSEIQIWEHVLKWGLAQNPELPSDVTNYSKEDFITLKNTLQQCIPYIRFHNLTSKEFLDRVFPYKKVLPKELYTELLREFLDNNTKTSSKSEPRIYKEVNSKDIDSNIITFQHAETISKWIKKLEIVDELTNSIEFKLLFRGSRDGFDPEKFHEICDNYSRTVTIAKVVGSDEILGGYNPIVWKSDNTYGTTEDSFIFSFNNVNRNENYILSRIVNKNHAIDNRYYYCGPIFGDGDLIILGFDLQTLRNYCRSSKSSYEKPIREAEDAFSIEEYEVFRVMFKI